MKKIIFFGVSTLIGLALFVGVLVNVGLAELWQTIAQFSFVKWCVVLALYTFSLYVTVYRWQLVLRGQGYRLTLAQIMPSKLVGFAGDYLSPSPNVGGEAIRAYVLKKQAAVPFSQGLASVITDKIMEFSFGLPFLLFSIFYVLFNFNLSAKIIAGLLFISITFIFLLLLFYYKMLQRETYFESIMRFLQLHRFKVVAKIMVKVAKFELIIIDFFKHHRKLLWQGIGLSFVAGLSTLAAMWFILIFLGLDVSLLDVILITTLNIVTFLLPIPGSFGSTETGQALVFSLLGYPPESGVAYALIFRSVDLLKVGLGLLFFSQFGLRIGQTIVKGQKVKNGNGNGTDDHGQGALPTNQKIINQ